MDEASKADENTAWWSDYQASTKLRRKFQKTDFEDNFDDLLGDLDLGDDEDTKKQEVTVPASSSTSGYDTESPGASSCSSPEEEPGMFLNLIFMGFFYT